MPVPPPQRQPQAVVGGGGAAAQPPLRGSQGAHAAGGRGGRGQPARALHAPPWAPAAAARRVHLCAAASGRRRGCRPRPCAWRARGVAGARGGAWAARLACAARRRPPGRVAAGGPGRGRSARRSSGPSGRAGRAGGAGRCRRGHGGRGAERRGGGRRGCGRARGPAAAVSGRRDAGCGSCYEARTCGADRASWAPRDVPAGASGSSWLLVIRTPLGVGRSVFWWRVMRHGER